MRKTLLFGFLCSMLPAFVYAECVPHICQDVHVQRLYPNTTGLIYVATTGDETKLDCSPVSGEYLSFNLSEPAGDVFYSTLLAAQIADRKVSIRIANGSDGCNVQYITHDKQ